MDVVAAAQAAGLGFVVITDHNTLDAKPHEGYRDGVLVIVGSELSTTAGHILALGIPDPPFRFSGEASELHLRWSDVENEAALSESTFEKRKTGPYAAESSRIVRATPDEEMVPYIARPSEFAPSSRRFTSVTKRLSRDVV